MPNINLIPEQEVALQTKTKAVKLSTVLTILLLILIGSIGGYFYYTATDLRKQIADHEAAVTSLRSDITSLSQIEISSRNLYTKSTTLTSIFASRILYSRMIEELNGSTPTDITIESFSLGNSNTLNISGDGATYNSIQDFSNNLLEKQLFTAVELNTVSLDNGSGRVKFFIIITYNPGVLH